jgi:hypothetical protein
VHNWIVDGTTYPAWKSASSRTAHRPVDAVSTGWGKSSSPPFQDMPFPCEVPHSLAGPAVLAGGYDDVKAACGSANTGSNNRDMGYQCRGEYHCHLAEWKG